MRTHVVQAIFKRNFLSYFSSPIGYVFICALVLLSAFAAFWPNEFFNANLANLDQLNHSIPWILLAFVPAVTMGIWADERRQGTDELLLTLPAADLEVVIGKYLAALAIFSVSLLFSLSNLIVLVGLGRPDIGLLAANYIGYWVIGAAMISIGMVPSFMTSNLTVAFILAAAFNAPLVFAASADAIIPWERGARLARSFSIEARFADFDRGAIALSSLVFFGSIVAVMLYLSMILIGRRHWAAKAQRLPIAGHYAVRVVCLILIAVGANVLCHRVDRRVDATVERLSSLSPRTRELLRLTDPARPVYIEAYISPEVPEQLVQTRLNLLSMLREVDRLGGDGVIVRINQTERFSREAAEAQEQFGITARPIQATSGGKFSVEEIILGAAFTCGLDKVVIPFFDRGIPVEYEVIRSIATVSQQERRRIGVVTTDAKLYGGFDIQTMSSSPNEQIINELQKQYEVVQVNADNSIQGSYDALLVVQPSSLTASQLENLLAAIRGGQPTVIFEDPFPFIDTRVPGTTEPRRPPGGFNPFQQQQPVEPKGAVIQLWSLLQINFDDRALVWDDYNPYPKIADFPREFVFIGRGSGSPQPFNLQQSATANLQQVLMLFAGSIRPLPGATLSFTPLLRTGRETGTVRYDEVLQRSVFGPSGLNPNRRFFSTGDSYTLAARITGRISNAVDESDDDTSPNDGTTIPPENADSGSIDVILVSDIDLLYSVFFSLRSRGRSPDAPINFDLDNVTFVLNALDVVAGDDRFIEIRGRRPAHRTLTAVESRTELARAQANAERDRFIASFDEQRAEAERRLNETVDELRNRPEIDAVQMGLEVATAMQVGQNRLQARIDELERRRDRELERIERDLALEIRHVQSTYKLAAISLPPIPPLLVGLFVYLRRRAQETLGVPEARLRRSLRA